MSRYERLEKLIGTEKLNKLKNSKIIIFGLGGVGSYACETLARSFIGKMTLVDYDTVDETNINRQLCALDDTVGKLKTEIMAQRIRLISPETQIKIINQMYLPENRDLFNLDEYDYVVDAIDNITAKIDLAKYCFENEIPLISAMGTGNKMHPELLQISDINKTSVCPLCKVMRRELKKRNINKLTVVYSKEEPLVKYSNLISSSAFVPAAAGIMLASYVVNQLIG
ncbi:MAG: tRNA threonylcarbamoyladenosine dehydratase [Clostridia bacterium]|nr:tRNA threonylcarbamoyladenosine dehydratase [Clostridia bacterium]